MSLNFANQVPGDTIWVAYLYYDGDCGGSPFRKAGWYQVNPGQTVSVWNGDVAWLNRYYYFYAESANGLVWNGPLNANVTNNAFDQCQWDDTATNRTVGFQLIDVDSDWDYTVNLVSSATPPPHGDGWGFDDVPFDDVPFTDFGDGWGFDDVPFDDVGFDDSFYDGG